MKCQSLTIEEVHYPEDSLLQKVWDLGEEKMLLVFNHKNLCFWEVRNVHTREKITHGENRDLMQSPVLLRDSRFSYIGIRKKLVDKEIRHNMYSIDYNTNAITEMPVFF